VTVRPIDGLRVRWDHVRPGVAAFRVEDGPDTTPGRWCLIDVERDGSAPYFACELVYRPERTAVVQGGPYAGMEVRSGEQLDHTRRYRLVEAWPDSIVPYAPSPGPPELRYRFYDTIQPVRYR